MRTWPLLVMTFLALVGEKWVAHVQAHPELHDKWIMDEWCFRTLQFYYPSLSASNAIKFDRGKFNRAMTWCFGTNMNIFDETNTVGVYHCQYTQECPYNTNTNSDKTSERRIRFYRWSKARQTLEIPK